MKYLFLILALLSFTSCNRMVHALNPKMGTDLQEMNVDDTFSIVKYKGHEYVVWKGFRKGGMVHSPDCPCFKEVN